MVFPHVSSAATLGESLADARASAQAASSPMRSIGYAVLVPNPHPLDSGILSVPVGFVLPKSVHPPLVCSAKTGAIGFVLPDAKSPFSRHSQWRVGWVEPFEPNASKPRPHVESRAKRSTQPTAAFLPVGFVRPKCSSLTTSNRRCLQQALRYRPDRRRSVSFHDVKQPTLTPPGHLNFRAPGVALSPFPSPSRTREMERREAPGALRERPGGP